MKKFKIAFIATSFIQKPDGISVYIENLLKEFIELSIKENMQIDIFIKKENLDLLKERTNLVNNKYINLKSIGTKNFFKTIYIMSKVLWKGNYDIVILPNPMPLILPDQKTIRVIHDLSFKSFSEELSIIKKIYSNFLILLTLYASTTIGYISETTKKNILIYFKVPKNKKFLYLPNGIPLKVKIQERPSLEKVENKFLSNNLKIIVVGRINRHKGFDRVLEFVKFADKAMQNDKFFKSIEIYMVGKKTEETDIILGNYQPENVKLNFTGFLTDKELNKLYKESYFCFFLSRNEGYGLPLVESLWLRTIPVLSDISIFREIMGDDYIFFSEKTGYGENIYKFVKKVFKDTEYRKNILSKIDNVVDKEKNGYKIAAQNLLKYIKDNYT